LGMIASVMSQYKKGALTPTPSRVAGEEAFLREYNAALIRKLEDKLLQLEQNEEKLKKVNAELSEALAKSRQHEEELERNLRELRTWHDVALDREDRIIGLKKEVNQLLGELGRRPRYQI